MDIAVFLRDGNKLVRKDDTHIIQQQPHKRFCRIVFPGPDVVDRLAIDQHPRIVRVLLCGDICHFFQDCFIPPELIAVVRLHPMDRVFRDLGMNTPDKADIVILPVQLRRALADNQLVVIPEPFVFFPELFQDLDSPLLPVGVSVLRDHQEHMPVTHLEQRRFPVIGFRHMPDQGPHFFGQGCTALIQFPHVEAQEQVLPLLLITVVDEVVQAPQIVGSQQRIVGVRVQQIHHRDQRKEEGGRCVGRLHPEPGSREDDYGNHRHAEEADHHLPVQPPAHPDQQYREQQNKQHIADCKDRGAFKGNHSVHDVHCPAGKDADGIRYGEGNEQGCRDEDIRFSPLPAQRRGFAGIDHILMQDRKKQRVIDSPQRIEHCPGQIRIPVHQIVEGQIRERGDDQHIQHRGKDAETLHPHLEGNGQQYEHNEADCQNRDFAGSEILLQLYRSLHPGGTPLCPISGRTRFCLSQDF